MASRVQGTGKVEVATSLTLVQSLASLPSVGNYIIVQISSSRTHLATITVSDNQGNTYSQAVASPSIGTADNDARIFYTKVATAAGTFTITITNGGNAADSFITAEMSEWTGLAASAVLDQTNSNSGATPITTLASGNITTTQADEVLVAVINSNVIAAQTVTPPGAPWTQRFVEANGAAFEVGDGEDRVVAATGTYSATWTISPNTGAGLTACIASFKAAVSAAFIQPKEFLLLGLGA